MDFIFRILDLEVPTKLPCAFLKIPNIDPVPPFDGKAPTVETCNFAPFPKGTIIGGVS